MERSLLVFLGLFWLSGTDVTGETLLVVKRSLTSDLVLEEKLFYVGEGMASNKLLWLREPSAAVRGGLAKEDCSPGLQRAQRGGQTTGRAL